MKKRLHDIFSTSRNERVGLIIIAVIVALFIGYTAFAPTKSELPATTQQLANEFQAAVDSSQVDTVKKKRKKRAKAPKKASPKHPTLTASTLEETETF